jgi:hypothetical protein
MANHPRRMYESAMSRVQDADILSRALRPTDSANILRILGMEILLKAAVALSGTEPKKSHNYLALWNQLPDNVRTQITDIAKRRMPGHADLSNIPKLLTWYRYIFEEVRYPYEAFENYAEDEIRELSRFWGEDLEADIEEALVRYYPSELTCLIEGLKVYVEAQLPNNALEADRGA